MGAKGGAFGIEMVTLENGGLVKSIHGGLHKNSIWYCMYGAKGCMECDREALNPVNADPDKCENTHMLHVRYDDVPGEYLNPKKESYIPVRGYDKAANNFGHGGSDFYCMWHFIEKIKGNPEADIIDVYEAMDMFLPGMFAYRSILDGGRRKDIPNLRNKDERELWRNDTACTDPETAGDMLLPTCVSGTPEIPDEVYERMRRLFESGYPVRWN